jgi:hypothetical protein
MKILSLIAVVFFSATVWSLPVLAHEDLHPVHGGRMIEVQSQLLELVVGDGVVDVYLSDHGTRPLAVDGAEGKASLLVGGKKLEVPLKPAGGNRLTGAGPVPAAAKGTVIVSVRLDGKTITGKFGGAP